MCVTNTAHRRSQVVSLGTAQLSACPSMISQRLLAGPSSISAQQGYNAPPSATSRVDSSAEFLSVASRAQKLKTKRRRKPQKPGKTAKMNDRHFVVHNYHDHAKDNEEDDGAESCEEKNQRRRGGVAIAFPLKLHAVLDQVEADGLANVVSWQPHGRCFVIHNPKKFVDHVMPRYFRQSKLTSFQRQLNLYGFCRLTRGNDAGGYYHELFLRGKTCLCKKMMRTKVKGTRFKAASNPEAEPDFYTMPSIVVTPNHSSDEEQSYNSHHTRNTQETLPSMHQEMQSHFALQQSAQPYEQQVQQYQPLPVAPAFPFVGRQQMLPIQPSDADHVLDEAVDELFMHCAPDDDCLSEFVHDWDPNFDVQVLQDDATLGFLLDKLLED